jgi:nitrate reductase NapAB chaperone NapD
MEKALVLITLKLESSSNLLEQLRMIPSVTDTEMVYGPYDAYAVVESETKEELRDSVMKIRQVYGVHSSLTCNVIP